MTDRQKNHPCQGWMRLSNSSASSAKPQDYGLQPRQLLPFQGVCTTKGGELALQNHPQEAIA